MNRFNVVLTQLSKQGQENIRGFISAIFCLMLLNVFAYLNTFETLPFFFTKEIVPWHEHDLIPMDVIEAA